MAGENERKENPQPTRHHLSYPSEAFHFSNENPSES